MKIDSHVDKQSGSYGIYMVDGALNDGTPSPAQYTYKYATNQWIIVVEDNGKLKMTLIEITSGYSFKYIGDSRHTVSIPKNSSAMSEIWDDSTNCSRYEVIVWKFIKKSDYKNPFSTDDPATLLKCTGTVVNHFAEPQTYQRGINAISTGGQYVLAIQDNIEDTRRTIMIPMDVIQKSKPEDKNNLTLKPTGGYVLFNYNKSNALDNPQMLHELDNPTYCLASGPLGEKSFTVEDIKCEATPVDMRKMKYEMDNERKCRRQRRREEEEKEREAREKERQRNPFGDLLGPRGGPFGVFIK